MSKLEDSLNRLKKHNESISTLYFKPPGIYHNAVVSMNNTNALTKMVRDAHNEEESALYNVNEQGAIRKDGERIGIMDHLATSAATQRVSNNGTVRSKRRGHNTLVDPIVKVPKEYYLKQNELMLEGTNNNNKNKKRRTGTLVLDEIFFKNLNNDKNSFVFDILLKKYSNDLEMKNLIMALRNGSVIGEKSHDLFFGSNISATASGRRTLLVEDFPSESLFKVLREVATNWPLKEYTSKYDVLLDRFNTVSAEVNELREKVAKQEENDSSFEQLIERERQEIQNLKLKLESMKRP